MKTKFLNTLAALTLVVVFLGGLVLWNKPSAVAPVPAVFLIANYTMESATKASKDSHKPLLVLATADWCMPCQELKRGALIDPKVAAAIEQKTLPVYLDTEKHQETAAELKVTSIPTLYLIRDGRVM